MSDFWTCSPFSCSFYHAHSLCMSFSTPAISRLYNMWFKLVLCTTSCHPSPLLPFLDSHPLFYCGCTASMIMCLSTITTRPPQFADVGKAPCAFEVTLNDTVTLRLSLQPGLKLLAGCSGFGFFHDAPVTPWMCRVQCFSIVSQGVYL